MTQDSVPSTTEFRRLLRLSRRHSYADLERAVAVYVGKEIVTVPWHFPPNMTGACLEGQSCAYILYAEGGPLVYRRLIQIHELVHLALRLPSAPARKEERAVIDAFAHANAIDDATAAQFVFRSASSLPAESSIERLASDLLEHLQPDRSAVDSSLTRLELD